MTYEHVNEREHDLDLNLLPTFRILKKSIFSFQIILFIFSVPFDLELLHRAKRDQVHHRHHHLRMRNQASGYSTPGII